MGNGLKMVEGNERETVILQRRAIRVRNDLFAGHIIGRGDVEYLRPCPEDAISPINFSQIEGKQLIKDISAGGYIQWSDIS
jgi:N-acetylneuraminate synthase